MLACNLAHPHLVADPAIYEPIRTGLADVALGVIVTVTGLSKSHAQSRRSGKKIPHARDWAALAGLVAVDLPEGWPRAEADRFESGNAPERRGLA